MSNRDEGRGMHAAVVASGILLSRLAGFIRLRVFAHYFGLRSDEADAFNAAFRIPNLLQNLFGEGALSASFIPVYVALKARGRHEEADRVAGAVGAALALVVSVLVTLGILLAPWLTAAIAPGFQGGKRELTTLLVRVLFPGAGLLVLSAWCLGLLNSHRRFLLSYTAPVVWNAAMIATLVVWGPSAALPRLVVLLAWGAVVGSALQLAVQWPAVRRVAPGVRPAGPFGWVGVGAVATSFVPAFVSRGVIQISAYVDSMIASLLPTGAVTGLANAQLLYTLPISVFGLSVAAAELPALSGEAALERSEFEPLRARLDRGLRRIAVFVVPSAVALMTLGDVVAAGLLQTGRFESADVVYVWGILAGASLGLLPATLGRLYASAFYALRDTRTPLRYATIHLVVAAGGGYVCAVPVTAWLGLAPAWGAAGLTTAASGAAWIELTLLRRSLDARIGTTGLGSRHAARLWTSAFLAAVAAWALRLVLPALHPAVRAACLLPLFAGAFATAGWMLCVPEVSELPGRLLGRRK